MSKGAASPLVKELDSRMVASSRKRKRERRSSTMCALFQSGAFHPVVALFLDVRDVARLRIALGGDEILRLSVPDAVWRIVSANHAYHAGMRTILPPPVSLPHLQSSSSIDWLGHFLDQEQLRMRVEVLEHTLLGYSFVYDEEEDVNARTLRRCDVPCLHSSVLPGPDKMGRFVIEFSNRQPTAQQSSSPFIPPFVASYSAFAVRARVYAADSKAVRQQSLAFCVATFGGLNALVVDESAAAGVSTPAVDHHAAKTAAIQRWFTEDTDVPALFVIKRLAAATYSLERVFVRVESTQMS